MKAAVKNVFWRAAVKSLKFLFSGVATLIGLVEILAKAKGGER